MKWQCTSSTLGDIPRKCSAAAFNHLAVTLPPLPLFRTAGVKQGFPVLLVYSPCNQFGYLYCAPRRALCCMKWSRLYLYQCKNKVLSKRVGDIQSIFFLATWCCFFSKSTFIRQSHSPRKKIQPAASQDSHQRSPALVLLSRMR